MDRLFGAAAIAVGLAVGFAGAPAGVDNGPGLATSGVSARAAVPGASQPRPVTLINGDRLLAGASPGGAISHELIAGTARGINAQLVTMALGGTAYVVPADAVPYLGRGLSPGLFDIASLLHDQPGGRLPVEVRYAGRVPSLPGISITSAAHGTARGCLTAASARAFGAALARQFAADHARASYGQDGLFGNGVSISLPGVAARRAAGRPAAAQRAGERHFPMSTLTVAGTNLAGRPDTGDVVFVFNADNSSRFDDPIETHNFFDHGVTKFSVPTGHYWAVGLFISSGGRGRGGGQRLVVLPQFTVRGNTTVRMSERAASQIQIVTPQPATDNYTDVTLVRTGRSGPPLGIGFEDPSAQPMWLAPASRKPTVGTLQAITASQLDSPPGAPGTPYEYGLAYLDNGTIPAQQRHVVHTATLAHVRARYYQAVPAQVQQFMTVGTKLADELTGYSGFGVIFRAPGRINEYLSPGRSTIWTDQYFQQAALFANSGGQFGNGRTFTPGERVTENWGAFPLHVAPNVNLIGARNPDPFLLVSAARTGNKLGFYLTPFSENQPGYTGSGYLPIPHVKVSGRYEIDENGKMIASGDPAHPETVNGEFSAVVTVSPQPSAIRLLLTARRSGAGYPLSSASRTVWTWRSVHEAGSIVPAGWYCPTSFRSAISFTRSCAAEPMMTLRYAIAGLSLDGSTAAGRQVLHVTAGHLPLAKATAVTSAAVSVSFDGGKTWHPATVTGHDGSYTATFTAPAGAKVSLRTSASDAAGGSISETITNAYQISS